MTFIKLRRSIGAKIQSRVKRLLGARQPKPHIPGVDPFTDLSHSFPQRPLHTFLDVGANVGVVARQIRARYPLATIHCFEPFASCYDKLKENTDGLNVHCHQVALGDFSGDMEVLVDSNNERSPCNSLLQYVGNADSACSEVIQVRRLSDLCEQLDIPTIDFLKIDTEGYDLEVLKGAESLLQSGAIWCIQSEVSMSPLNTMHVDFQLMRTYLEERHYALFGLYNQCLEWRLKLPILRRCDAVFIYLPQVTMDNN